MSEYTLDSANEGQIASLTDNARVGLYDADNTRRFKYALLSQFAAYLRNKISFGGGAAVIGAEGNISVQCPGVAGGQAPGATGADNVVLVYSIPASSFDQAGRMIGAEAWIQFAANANSKRAKLWFNPTAAVVGSTITGGTLMADTGAVTQSGGSALLSGSVIKRGAANSNTQTVLPGGAVLAASHAGLSTPSADTTATENAAILVAVTINNATTATDALGVALQVNAMN